MTRQEAIERINARQNAMNIFTNIGEEEIRQEMESATLRDVRNWIMNNWKNSPKEIKRNNYSETHYSIEYADGSSIEYKVRDISYSLILKTIILDGTRTFRGVFRYENFGWKFVA